MKIIFAFLFTFLISLGTLQEKVDAAYSIGGVN